MYDPQEYWNLRSWSGDIEPNLVNKIAPYILGNSVIDFGCGYGRHYPLFRDMDYYGIDISEHFIKRFNLVYPEAIIKVADIRDFRIKRRFDMGFTWTVLEHVEPKDMNKTIKTMALLTRRWILIEPDIPFEKADKLAPYCFRHVYKDLFEVKEEIPLEGVLKMYEVLI